MNHADFFWALVKLAAFVSLLSGFGLWFLIPKKWIVWSEKAAQILPAESPAPWSSLNKLGKFVYIIFFISLSLIVILMIYGYFVSL